MKIEVVAKTWYTVELTDEDVEKIRQYIQAHKKTLGMYYTLEEAACDAVWDLSKKCEIELFADGKETESDFSTEEIKRSEFEDQTAEEILGITLH